METSKLPDNLITELHRGTLTLCILSQLTTPRYGYSLLKHLTDSGIDIEANTLYPLLRRLEQQGLLTGSWNTDENRPRKFYRLSQRGALVYDMLQWEWRRENDLIERLIKEEHHDDVT